MSKTSNKKIAFIVFFVLVIAIIFYYFAGNKPSKKPPEIKNNLESKYPNASTEKPNEELTRNWQTYLEPSGFFSLKYPDNIKINNTQNGIQFNIDVKKIFELGDKSLNAEKNKEFLARGEIGVLPNEALDSSIQVESLDNGKVFSIRYATFRGSDKCTILLKQEDIFYYGAYQIDISYQILNVEEYISTDDLVFDQSCQTKVWKDEKNFYQKITENKTEEKLQLLWNDFDQILKSITIK